MPGKKRKRLKVIQKSFEKYIFMARIYILALFRNATALEVLEIVRAHKSLKGERPNEAAIKDKITKTFFNSQNLAEMTLALHRFITLEAFFPREGYVGQVARFKIGRKLKAKASRRIFLNWKRRAITSETMFFILQMADRNFGRAREVLRYFLKEDLRIPYIDVMVEHAMLDLKQKSFPIVYTPDALTAEMKNDLEWLFSSRVLIDWAKSKEVNLKHFAGMTHTMLGLYDWISYPEYRDQTGFSDFPRATDVCYDYGGGFGTPDISRLMNRDFISLDLLSPRLAEEWNLRFQVLQKWKVKFGIGGSRLQTDEERRAYLHQLHNQKWEKFDVFTDSINPRFNSYFIVSFGFLSSTVGSLSEHKFANIPGVANFVATGYMATRRIVELIAAGKEVHLFAYQRATGRDYEYRTVFFHFKDHRIVKLKVWPEDLSYKLLPIPTIAQAF